MSAKSKAVLLVAETSSPVADMGDSETESIIAYACWLSPDVLVLTTTAAATPLDVEAFAECGKKLVRLTARSLTYHPGSAELSDQVSQILMLRLPAGHTVVDALSIVLLAADHSMRLEAPMLRGATISLDALLRMELAALGPATRADVLAFMVAGLAPAVQQKRGTRRSVGCCSQTRGANPVPGRRLELSKSLHIARQALRERLPVGVISVAAPQGLNIDAVLAVDERNFYVQGWMHDEQAAPTHLTAVSPEGCRTELMPRLYRFRRPDVEQFYGDLPDDAQREHGWIVHFQPSAPSLLTSGWVFELGNAVGSELEVYAPDVTRDLSTIREMILHDLNRERLPDDRLRAEHIAPALSRLEDRRRSFAVVESVDQFGSPPAEPEVTIVVPLYGRVDFLEHQLAQFIHDPELPHADIIYILDSPDLADPFRGITAQLAELYAVPFRAVVLSHNVGFSGVNNLGAHLARGRLLLLLNSDVFPREPGWLSAMTSFYDATPGIGALAPKLLYEDDSIQHAGLYFRRLVDSGVWNNEHYYKGLYRTLPAANVARAVPALTAACMMIDLALYRELGGLREMYIQGDYEDSDLCLRLAEKGLRNWYMPGVELYHLEGQSYPSQTRQLAGAYNRWLHTHVWGHEMASLTEALQ